MQKLPIGINMGHFEEATQFIPNNQINQNLMNRLKLDYFRAIRFMDWQKTNSSPISENWQLPTAQDGDWQFRGGRWRDFAGVPLKHIVDVANSMDAQAWICIPHKASAEMMRKMVGFVLDRANHRPIFELSNEVWNTQFRQYWYNMRKGIMARMTLRPTLAVLRWQSHRTASLATVVGNHGDLVISGQAANPWITEQLITMKALRGKIKAIAIAPYFGARVQSTDFLFERLSGEIEGVLRQNVRAHKAVARKFGVELWGYEGGQHLIARDFQQRITFGAFNRSAEMHQLNQRWLNMWFEEGGGLICPYSFASQYGNQAYGHVEILGEQFVIRPKYNALFSTLGRQVEHSLSDQTELIA